MINLLPVLRDDIVSASDVRNSSNAERMNGLKTVYVFSQWIEYYPVWIIFYPVWTEIYPVWIVFIPGLWRKILVFGYRTITQNSGSQYAIRIWRNSIFIFLLSRDIVYWSSFGSLVWIEIIPVWNDFYPDLNWVGLVWIEFYPGWNKFNPEWN